MNSILPTEFTESFQSNTRNSPQTLDKLYKYAIIQLKLKIDNLF